MKTSRLLSVIIATCLLCMAFGPVTAQPSQPNAAPSYPPAYAARYRYVSVDAPANNFHVAGSISGMYNILFGEPFYVFYDDTHHALMQSWHYTNGAASCNGVTNGWTCQVLDDGNGGANDVGKNNSVSQFGSWSDPQRGWGASYYDATHAAVKFVEYRCITGSGCNTTITTVFDPAIGSAGTYGTALAYDSAGTPYILFTCSFNAATDSLYLAHRNSSGIWSINVLVRSSSAAGTDVGYYPSLAIHNDKLYAAYYDKGNDALFYASNAGSNNPNNCYGTELTNWSCWFIDYKIGKWPSIAVTSSGVPEIASYDSTDGKISFAAWGGGSPNCGYNNVPVYVWTCSVIETIGAGITRMGVSLALDGNNYPAIAYVLPQDEGPDRLRLARPNSAYGYHSPAGSDLCGPAGSPLPIPTWSCLTLDGGDQYNDEASSVAVVLLPNGLASVGYSEDDSYYHVTRFNVTYQQLLTFMPYSRK